MEECYDALLKITDRRSPEARGLYRLLNDYMTGGQWISDYEADEQGLLPPSLKRGVLSQDGLYTLLGEFAEDDDMEKILFINACVRDDSRTLKLAEHALSRVEGNITRRDLGELGLMPLDRALLARRDSLLAAGDTGDEMLSLAREFAGADRIVIAAPYWDLAFPALLKIYLEHITVSGVTFEYVDGVPHGLCRAKQLVYVTTAGGPIFANFGYDYVKTLANVFYGISDTAFFAAEGLDVYCADVDGILAAATAQIDAEI